MALPEPVWSDDDIKVAKEEIYNPSSLIRHTWSKDSTKLAILEAMASCQARLGHDGYYFDADIVDSLAQKYVCFLHSYSLEVDKVYYLTLSGPFLSSFHPLVPVQISRFPEASC